MFVSMHVHMFSTYIYIYIYIHDDYRYMIYIEMVDLFGCFVFFLVRFG